MTSPLEDLSQAKRLATGSGLSLGTGVDLTPRCESREQFDSLVSDYSKFYREEIGDDVAFLTASARDHPARSVEKHLYRLRTAAQHSDNQEANHYYSAHVGDAPDWQALAAALAQRMEDALSALVREALAVSRDPRRRASWQAEVALNVEAVFESVADDLRLGFTPANKRRMINQVRTRLRITRNVSDPRALAQEYCVQEMTANRRPLPVPYFDLLDYLNVLGKRDAPAAILLAHSVATLNQSLRNGEFLERVAEAWETARR
ncbi:hypothetical protein [Demequina sp. NBRC 110054]|uniref:hypothetical protein n=1 Tax=Demequina sp. NBRC 110054 TaxID=1570343 RepID=UPI0011787BA7|nr:hypothetical protein [Demequina sp. NBRC 110054]